MHSLFVLSLSVLLATWVGYPLGILLWARLRPRPVRPAAEPFIPSVSVIVPARDEEAVIERKLESIVEQGYPAERLEIIVVDDGSADATAAVARACARRFAQQGGLSPPIYVIVRSGCAGKAVALNAGVAAASGDVLVLSDARQPLAPGALAALVVPLADPAVGGVSGGLARPPGEGGLGLYRRLDDAIRRAEATAGSSVGVTGALWALRRSLWRDLPAGLILDDLFQPLWVARQGARVVVAPAARVWDAASPDPARELRRRTRTLAGNFQLLRAAPWLLSPTDNPLFLELLGHKLSRLVAPLALVGLFVSSAALTMAGAGPASPLFPAALAGQVLIYGLAAANPARPIGGWVGACLRLCRAFVLLHLAVVVAAWRVARGEEGALWRDVPSPLPRRELRA